jgi:acyl-CoA dehydrogenase
MEYHDSARAKAVAARAREFVDREVLPMEREHLARGETISKATIEALQEEAKARDLYQIQVPEKFGGQGLDFREMLPTFEQVGRAMTASRIMAAGAPSEGNIRTFEKAGTEEQKERWLYPILRGELSSAFSMTEPMQGGGSDPKMLQTTAEKDTVEQSSTSPAVPEAQQDGDEWVIDGHKWWTSGGANADVLLVMARSDMDAHPYEGCTNFIVPADADGVEVVRNVDTIGGHGVTEYEGGHAEIKYNDVRVGEEHVLGEVNGGFQLSQYRLGGGRLTHCMRFSGMADRALDVAKAYMTEREAFGSPLADKQALRHRIADAETRLHAARTMVRHAAREIAEGNEARIEIAMAKTFTATVVQEIVDLAVQCCGGNGIGKDLPLAYFYESVRAFRIVDGADEVHRRSIARDAFEDPRPEEVEHVLTFDESLREAPTAADD